METVSSRIAAFVQPLRYEDLPVAVIEKCRMLILDTVGVCIGSRQLDFAAKASELALRWGGPAQSSVIGEAQQVSAQHSALANGVLAHGQDFDDTHTGSLVHSSGVLVPALLATAERDRSTGREAISALAAATEATIRLALPARHRFSHRGFQTTMVTGTFGAALVAARTARFDAGLTTQALGVAGSVTSGLMECVPAGASTKQIHPGWAAMSGIMAAEFANAGFTGPATVFEGGLGLYRAFLHGTEVDFEDIFRGLGEQWQLLDIRPKLYPCGHPLNTFIDAAASLRRDGKAPLQEIAAILCEPAQGSVSMVCEPWEKKLAPASGYEARFSMPFAVAVMLVHGRAGIGEFTDAMITDPDVQAVMRKTSYRVEPAFVHKDMPARITITLSDGSQHRHDIPSGRGDALHPIAREELLDKFAANTNALPRQHAQDIAGMILQLEGEADFGRLMTLLRRA